MSKIDLLAFNVKNAFDGDKFDRALNWLPQVEHRSVLRYKYEKDRYLGLANLLLRRHYFTKELNVGWNELEFGRLPGGKPILKNYDNMEYDYNTSHEGDWVIFGCTRKMRIGIDAVAIDRPKDTSIDAFIRSFTPQLTHDEFDFIMDDDNEDIRLKTFYQYWGCKESYTKALGVGLSLELKTISFMNDSNNQIKMDFEGKRMDNWCYHLSYLDEETIAVVCSGFTDPTKPLDDNIKDFIKTSEPLGRPLHRAESMVYDQVKFEDIENNKWMQKD